MTSSPPATIHVGRGGQQRGAAPAPPLDTATTVSDTLIVARHGRLAFSMTCVDCMWAKGISNVATTAADYPGTPKTLVRRAVARCVPQPAPAAHIHVFRPYAVIKRLGA